LERTLESLSGVQRRPCSFSYAAGQRCAFFAASGPRWSHPRFVLLRVREREFDLQPEEVQAIVAGAVSDLPRADVAVVIQPALDAPLPQQDLVWVGPLLVSPGGLWGIGLVLSGWLALTAWLAVSRFSSRRGRTRVDREAEEGKSASSSEYRNDQVH
jgi:hypothetical protein